MGIYPSRSGEKTRSGRSAYSCEKYKFFLEAPFEISNKCCNVMKKTPVHRYARETGRYPITAQMATESRLRTQQWLKNGCNGFDMKSPISNPMSFWTEQDVLTYIKLNNLPIASVYGEIVEDVKDDEVGGQLTMSDIWADAGIFDAERPLLKTTGCKRTGCIFCGYGCHMKDDTRFVDLKVTHPKLYDYIMKPEESGGLGYKTKIDWINKHGNLNIKYQEVNMKNYEVAEVCADSNCCQLCKLRHENYEICFDRDFESFDSPADILEYMNDEAKRIQHFTN